MKIKAIIVDFGGVISLPRNLYYVTFYPDTDEWHEAEKGNIPEEEFWKKLENFYHKSPQDIIKMIMEEKIPNTPLLNFLKEIKAKNKIKTAFITNSLKKITQSFIEKWQLTKYFDVMVISAEEKLAKPDPQIFLLAVNKLKVSPEECLYVGKKESYVEVALSLGMRGFVYTNFDDFKAEVSLLL